MDRLLLGSRYLAFTCWVGIFDFFQSVLCETLCFGPINCWNYQYQKKHHLQAELAAATFAINWFAPQGGWEALYAKHPTRYAGCNHPEEEEEDLSEEGSDFEGYESDDSFEYNQVDFENDFGFGDVMDDELDELEYAFLFL